MFPFHNLSQDILNHMAPGQRAMQDTLLATDYETVTSGAISVTAPFTELSVTGTKAYTLAAGPTGIGGMIKTIRCTVAASTPIGTLTITSPEDTAGLVCATTFVFNTVGQMLRLIWTGTKWRALDVRRAGSLAVVPGTTILTGYSLNQNYALAVDGTLAGTTTGGLPNGSVTGELCTVTCTSAANTPVGSIDGVYMGMTGTAYTHLGAIGVAASGTVVGDCAVLQWTGAAWFVVYQNGCTLS